MLIEGLTEEIANVLACPTRVSPTFTPAFAYPGGKRRLRNAIASFMPECGGIYAEPFAGRANVFWKAVSTFQFSDWWLNDTRTAPFFECLISHGDTLDVPAHTKEEFERLKRANDYGNPASILLAPYLTFSGAGYRAGYRSAKGSPTRIGYQRTLRRAHEILIQTQPRITALDWKLVVSELGKDDFAYFDPPYFRAHVHGYRNNDIDHLELVEELRNAKYRWILSEYSHDLYLDAFGPPFWVKDVQLLSTNFRDDNGKGRRLECLWRNY